MSDETITEDQELKEMEEQILAAEAEKAKAAEVEPTPSPEPDASTAPETPKEPEAPVTPTQVQVETPKDDPMEWAQKKGFKTPEDMARALLKKEQDFHAERQNKERDNTPPVTQFPPQQWQPRPDMGGYPPPPAYGYPPPPQRISARDVAQNYPQLAPEDVERVLPLVIDAARAISANDVAALERKYAHIERVSQRNSELMSLMQDPAFRDERVQQEIHKVLDADPQIFQRERKPHVAAFQQALANMTRKQLQQGTTVGANPSRAQTPPVTAGGGNGSANTSPINYNDPAFQRKFESWSMKEQEAFINSNGRIIPKK